LIDGFTGKLRLIFGNHETNGFHHWRPGREGAALDVTSFAAAAQREDDHLKRVIRFNFDHCEFAARYPNAA